MDLVSTVPFGYQYLAFMAVFLSLVAVVSDVQLAQSTLGRGAEEESSLWDSCSLLEYDLRGSLEEVWACRQPQEGCTRVMHEGEELWLCAV